MFTGLVTDVGTVRSVEDRNGLRRFEVESAYPLDEIEMGASIMHSGVCLTVVDMGQGERGAWFATEAVPETLSKTILGDWHVGSRVNLEQSLKLGDELGGHFVFGHVDGVGEHLDQRALPQRVDRQEARHQANAHPGLRQNADAEGSLLTEVAEPDAEGRALLTRVAEKTGLSARGYHRVLRVARTIADLDGSETVRRPHVAEAVSFRIMTLAG